MRAWHLTSLGDHWLSMEKHLAMLTQSKSQDHSSLKHEKAWGMIVAKHIMQANRRVLDIPMANESLSELQLL